MLHHQCNGDIKYYNLFFNQYHRGIKNIYTKLYTNVRDQSLEKLRSSKFILESHVHFSIYQFEK